MKPGALAAVAAFAIVLSGCASLPMVTARPAIAFAPAIVDLTVWLPEVKDEEKWYCPEVRWDFGDGGVERYEADCPPWGPGAFVERHYSAWWCYRWPGEYQVLVSLWRAHRKLTEASTSVSIRWSPMGGRC